MKSSVLGCGLPIREVKHLLRLWDNKKLRIGQTERLMTTANWESLNSKLYSKLLDCLQGQLSKHVRDIRGRVVFSDGLSALLALGEVMW